MTTIFAAANREWKKWLEETAQAVLDAVSENFEAPQAVLLTAIYTVLRDRLGELVVVRKPRKPAGAPRTQPEWV